MGSFVMDNSINKEYFSNLDIGHPKNFDTNGNLPTGGNGTISIKTIKEVRGRVPKGTSPFKKTGFDAGHILGRQLFKGTRFNTSKKNNKNIYISKLNGQIKVITILPNGGIIKPTLRI